MPQRRALIVNEAARGDSSFALPEFHAIPRTMRFQSIVMRVAAERLLRCGAASVCFVDALRAVAINSSRRLNSLDEIAHKVVESPAVPAPP